MKRRIIALASSLAVLLAVLLTGCGGTRTASVSTADTGVLTLRVNPEIAIAYDKDGLVSDVTGLNADGQQIVAGYTDYIGKTCDTVLQELVVLISDAGYFVEEVDGNARNIVIQIEPGSALPGDDFVQKMSDGVQSAVRELSLTSGIVSIDADDYDPAYATDSEPSPYITLEKAREIALTQANVAADDATFTDREFDHDDGTPTFELEFFANGYEYEYEIHAVTGAVLKAEHEPVPASQATAAGQTANNSTTANRTDYGNTDYGSASDGITDYGNTDYGSASDGITDYGDTDYGRGQTNAAASATAASANRTDYGRTDYGSTDYGRGQASAASTTAANNLVEVAATAASTTSNANRTDYGVTDYGRTDYGITDYGNRQPSVTVPTTAATTAASTTASANANRTDYGNTDYGNTDYGNTNYGNTNYGNTDYGNSDYGNSDYGRSDYR